MKCVNCPYHEVIPDPDPNDWFNYDDQAIVCKKVTREPDLTSKYLADRSIYQPVSVCLRPYEINKVEAPDWCPESIKEKRDKQIEKIV